MSHGREISEQQIQESIEGHERRNLALRRVLIEKGVDLTEPRTVDCHFWAWSEEDSIGLADGLTKLGFKITARRLSKNSTVRWNIEASIWQSAALTLRPEFTDELARLAAANFARYDGWGTSI